MRPLPASKRETVGSQRLPPTELVRAFRAALSERLNSAAAPLEAWNALVVLTAYELAASRGLRPTELSRLRACDVSPRFDILFLPRPKATRRGADPRPIPLGPGLLTLITPLVVGLRITAQDSATIVAEWSGDKLQPLRPGSLRRLAAEVTGWPWEEIPDVGNYRHLYATRRKALARQAKESAPEAYVSHRRWSASLGHGQSGGWSIYLPNRLDDEIKALKALDARWPLPSLARTLLFHPARVAPGTDLPPHRARGQPKRRPQSDAAGSDWASKGLELPAVELDRMIAAHERLWRFDWAGRVGLNREHAIAVALLIQLAGFSDFLVAVDTLSNLDWSDLELTGDGPMMSVQLAGALGKLRFCLGATETLLFQQLYQMRVERPFAEIDSHMVHQVLLDIFGLPVKLEELQRANHLLHLLTHDTEQVGYLLGRAAHKIRAVAEPRAARPRERHRSVLAPLISDLRCDARLTLRELDSRFDRLFPDWRSWSLDTGEGTMTPALALAALRTCCSTPSRRDSRRSRSAHTLRWLAEELVRIDDALQGQAVSQLGTQHLQVLCGDRRGESRTRAALHWLARACRQTGVKPPKRMPIRERLYFHSVELPRSEDVVRVLDSFAGEERLLVSLILAACTVARKAEVANLKVQDVRPGDVLRLEIGRAKGGKPAVRETPAPAWLCPLLPELDRYLASRDKTTRLIGPLACRSASADAIFQRIAYRLAKLGVNWSPHLMRTIAATEANDAGDDRAEISHRLGHVLVKTTSTNYVAVDPKELRASAERLAAKFPVQLTAAAIAFLLGISEDRLRPCTRGRTAGSRSSLLEPTAEDPVARPGASLGKPSQVRSP